MKFDPKTIGLFRDVGTLPWPQKDLVGGLAVANATNDLLAGKVARFAIIHRFEGEWHLTQIIRFKVVNPDAEQKKRGYGDMIRVHDYDGDPSGDNSHALPIYFLENTMEVAAELAMYLTRPRLGQTQMFVRLSV